MVGGIGWQGIVPSRAAKMGSLAVDSGIAKLGTPKEFFKQLDPEKIAEQIVVSTREDIPRDRRPGDAARAPAALGRPTPAAQGAR